MNTDVTVMWMLIGKERERMSPELVTTFSLFAHQNEDDRPFSFHNMKVQSFNLLVYGIFTFLYLTSLS